MQYISGLPHVENTTPLSATSQEMRRALPERKRGRLTTTVRLGHNTVRLRRRGSNGPHFKLLCLPLDMLFEIFGECHPLDLIHLTQTSKALRAQLLAPSSKTIWMSSRKSVEGPSVPDPPKNLTSEFTWAILLFGGSKCTDCGLHGVRSVDFGILRRLCVSCRKANLVAETLFRKSFPNIRPEVMQGLLFTRIGGWDRGHPSAKNRYFHRGDIHQVALKFDLIENNDLRIGQPDSRANPDSPEWQLRTREISEYMSHRIETYEKWQADICEINSSKAQEARDARFTSIKSRLVVLGNHERDIDHPRIRRHKAVSARSRLTEQAWTKMLPILQPILIDLRRTRHTQTRYMRIYTFDCFYRCLLREFVPMQSLYLPSAHIAQTFPLIQRLIEDDIDNTDNPGLFSSISNELLLTLSHWMEENKQSLLTLLPNDLRYDTGTMLPLRLRDTSMQSARHYANCGTNSGLDDARAVFVRSDGYSGALIGSEVAQAWKSESQIPLVFSEKGYEASNAIINLLSAQLDETLRISEAVSAFKLDLKADLYVVCNHCHHRDQSTSMTNVNASAYTWRAAIDHYLDPALEDFHPHPSWRLLKKEELPLQTSGYQDNSERPGALDFCWSCNHCSQYVNDYPFGATRPVVADHVSSVHSVSCEDIKDDIDIFYRPQIGKQRPRARPLAVSLESDEHVMMA